MDRRAPTITIAAPASATFTLGQTVNSGYGCTDGGSGIVTCSASVPSGAPIDTATVGTRAFTVSSSDAVGNPSIASEHYTVTYGVCPLFDATKAHKAGSTIPIKLNLCSAAGANVSSSGVTIIGTGVHLISTNAPGPLEDSGNANPDNQFRFADGSYIFNLSLKGFSQGTYALEFTAGADPMRHSIQFQVR